MKKRMAAAAVAALAWVGCADPTGVAESEGVRVESRSSGLTIQNRSDSGIYYFAVDQDLAARIEWVGCGWQPVADPEQECGPGIRPGEKEYVPASRIEGWGDSPRVIVYWWNLVAAPDGGFQWDSLQALVVSR